MRPLLPQILRLLFPGRKGPFVFERQPVTWPTKPVAMYYSRIDLALGESRASHWGGAHDNHYRVYEVLRSAGYNVTWI